MAKKTFYFPHDGNARNDDRIIAVRMRHKMEGYGVYFAILERILESSNYMCAKDYNLIAFDLHVGAELIKSIVENFGLFKFTEDGEFFYSESFNDRMKPLENIREQRSLAGKKSAEKRAKNNGSSTVVQRSLTEKATEESIVDNSIEKETSTKVDEKKKAEELKRLEEEAKAKDQIKKLNAAKAATLKRKDDFYDSLRPYVPRYGKEMIRAFFDYWTEMNKQQTKMRVDKQSTWDLALRLGTWANREPINGKSKIQQEKATTYVVPD